SIGETIAHEIGHSLGLNHTDGEATIALPGAANDVMAQGSDPYGTKTFSITANALKVALGLNWTPGAAQQAINYFGEYLRASESLGKFFNAKAGADADPDVLSASVHGPVAWIVSDADQTFVSNSLELGSVSADGIGEQALAQSFRIAN